MEEISLAGEQLTREFRQRDREDMQNKYGIAGAFADSAAAALNETEYEGDDRPDYEDNAIRKYGCDLTRAAARGELDPVIGRESLIDRVVQILARRTKNNPLLIGEPGVGKTAIVEGLAQQLVSGQLHSILGNKHLIAIDLPGMVAGASYRGMFEQRIRSIINVAEETPTILFIDEAHMLIGAGCGSSGSSMDAANILKPSMARGKIRLIGATTESEYRKYILKDRALERRFQPVYVCEPDAETTLVILLGLRSVYQAHYEIEISDESLSTIVKLAEAIEGRYFPDKAIDLLDESLSKLKFDRVKKGNWESELVTLQPGDVEATFSHYQTA